MNSGFDGHESEKDPSAPIKRRGVITQFKGFRVRFDGKGEKVVGGNGIIHQEECQFPMHCEDPSHKLAYLTFVPILDSDVRGKQLNGKVVGFEAKHIGDSRLPVVQRIWMAMTRDTEYRRPKLLTVGGHS